MSRHLADIALGGLNVQIPGGPLSPELKSSALVWGNLAFAAVLDHDGYGDIALEEVTRIAAWLKRPETEEPATKVELPAVGARPRT
jgi:hypothetical protein